MIKQLTRQLYLEIFGKINQIPLEDRKKLVEALKHRSYTKAFIVLLLTKYPMSIREIHFFLNQFGNYSYDHVKKLVYRLKKKGILIDNNFFFTINYYYHDVLYDLINDTSFDKLVKSKLFYNDLSYKKGHSGTKRDKKGQIFINFEKVKEKAKQIMDRDLEPSEEIALRILVDHYNKTKRYFIDPDTFLEKYTKLKSSSSYYKNVILEDVYRSIKMTLTSHKIAYIITNKQGIIKIGIYKSFIEEIEK